MQRVTRQSSSCFVLAVSLLAAGCSSSGSEDPPPGDTTPGISVVNSTVDGTVTDSRSGLRWQCCPVGCVFDDNGSAACFSDWRVPKLKELVSIVEFRCFGPANNTSLFPDTPAVTFWSSTTTQIINTALVVNFEDAENSFSYLDIVAFEQYVRLVRGGG